MINPAAIQSRSAWRSFDASGRIVAAVLALLALVSAVHATGNAMALMGSMDIGVSMRSAQVLQRDNPYPLYWNGLRETRGPPTYGQNPFAMEPVQMPSALMLLWPYSMLSWPELKVSWLVSNFAFTAGLLMLAFRRFLPGQPLWLYISISALFVMSTSWRNVITNGQHGLASLFFLFAAAELADRRRSVAAGLALTAGLLKYSMTMFLLPWFVLKRQWTALAIAIGLHLMMTVGVALWLHTNPFTLVTGALETGRKVLLVSGYLDLFAVFNGMGAPPAIPGAVSLACLAAIMWKAVTRRVQNEDFFLAALCFLSVTLMYHRQYDFIVLIVPLMIAIRHIATQRFAACMTFASVLLVWFLDRPVVFLTDWLESRNSAYYYFMAFIWYATLVVLLTTAFASRRPATSPAPVRV